MAKKKVADLLVEVLADAVFGGSTASRAIR